MTQTPLRTRFWRKKGWRVGGAVVCSLVVLSVIGVHAWLAREPEITGGAPAVRLIDSQQYSYAIHDLFGDDIHLDTTLVAPARKEGLLSIGAATVAMTSGALRQFDNSARSVAAQVMDDSHRGALVLCKPRKVAEPDDECARQFLSGVGRFLYRRSLSDAELALYVGIARAAAQSTGGFYTGLAESLAGMLVSPKFLYFVESVEPDPAHQGRYRLDATSKATRLSLFLWDSSPDMELLDAAAKGELHTVSGLEHQVERMLAQPERLDRGTRAFFADLLLFDKFETLTKDSAIYPIFTPGVGGAAQEQMLRLITDHLLRREADYRDLFTTRLLPVNPILAALYEVPIEGEGWSSARLDERRAGGLVTTLGFLAENSHPGRSSPTLRGRAIRETLLCQKVPDPPPNVNFRLFEGSLATVKTARQRLALHASDPVCIGCHKMTDPIGLSLENFDGAGSFRAREMGAQIDVHGNLDGAPYGDVATFAQALRNHPGLPSCLVNKLFSYGVGHGLGAADRPYLAYMSSQFAAHGYRYPELLRQIVLSRAFFAVTAPTPVLQVARVQ